MRAFGVLCTLILVKAQDLYQPAKANPQFTALYDLSNIPTNRVIEPHAASEGPPPANACKNRDLCSWGCDGCLGPNDISVCSNKGDWALTFDDGPSPSTPGVLAALKKLNVKATFFVVGTQVVQYPQYLKQAFDDGHLIAMHSWSHRALTTLTNDEIIAEFEYTARAIENVIHARPKYYRPPFGDFDNRVRAVLKSMGFIPVIWNYDLFDYEYKGGQAEKTKILDDVKRWTETAKNMNTGIISLSHDVEPQPSSLLPEYLPIIKSSGARLVTVADCVHDSSPYLIGNPKPTPVVTTDPVITRTVYVVETTTSEWPTIATEHTFTPIPTLTTAISATQATTIFIGFWLGLAIILTFSI